MEGRALCFVGLALAALLILNFSKGITFFEPTYNFHVTHAHARPA